MPAEGERVPTRVTTLQDVGQRAGVSFQTVSKVLRGQGSVTDATRERVFAAADELGYVANSLASGLARRSTSTIGFIASGLASFVLAPMLLGAEREASRNGYSVIFKFVDHDAEDGTRLLRQLIERRVDGVVSAALTLHADEAFGLMLRDGVPSVAMHPVFAGGVPIVGEDSDGPGVLATEHLLTLGHTRIATIVGYASVGLPRRGRLAGFVNALEDAGIAFDEDLIDVGLWTLEGGYNAMHRLLTRDPSITGIVAQNDHMAMGAIRAIRERGLHVPRDVSIVGCDDVDFARFTHPPLTTVRLSFEHAGSAAVGLLVDRLRGETAIPERVVLPSALIVRESTGPVRFPGHAPG